MEMNTKQQKKKLLLSKNVKLGKIYDFVRAAGPEVYEKKCFALVRYHHNGKIVLATFREDGTVLKEYPTKLYELAVGSKYSLDELHKGHVSKQKTKEKTFKNIGNKKPVKTDNAKLKTFSELNDMQQQLYIKNWYAKNSRKLNSLMDKKVARLNKKGKQIVLTKFILNKKDLPFEEDSWQGIAKAICENSSFTKFDVKKFGIRFFVD